MQTNEIARMSLKLLGILVIAIISGLVGAAFSRHFGTSSYTISYSDFISVLLTCLGVMLTIVTLFVGLLAVLGWTSIESRLRDHSIEFIGSQLQEGKPLGDIVRKAVREAVYEGILPTTEPDTPFTDANENIELREGQ